MVLLTAQRKGGVAEWLKATVLKTVNVQAFVGSNPTPSVLLSSSLWCDTAAPACGSLSQIGGGHLASKAVYL